MSDTAQTTLRLDALAGLPQLKPLLEFAPRLWACPDVVALWVGGSVARGEADRYSDVDLRVAVRANALEQWKRADIQTRIGDRVAAQTFLSFGEGACLHHLVLTTGDIYDIWVQSETEAVGADSIAVLGCREEGFRLRLNACKPDAPAAAPPAAANTARQALVDFWINTHKHRKVLDRDLPLVAMTGIQAERALLLRLWHMELTGEEMGGSKAQTIHGLTRQMRVVEQAKGVTALQIMGASLASRKEIFAAIETLRDEVAQTGRALAARLGFAYPAEAEAIVRQGWQEFRNGEE